MTDRTLGASVICAALALVAIYLYAIDYENCGAVVLGVASLVWYCRNSGAEDGMGTGTGV